MAEKNQLEKCAADCAEVVKRVTDDLYKKNSVFIEKESARAIEHYEKQEEAFSVFLEREERRSSRSFNFNIFMWGIMLSIVGFVAIYSQNKADANKVLYMDDFQKILKLGEKYRDSRYVIKAGADDSAQYHWYIETLIERSVTRSGTKRKTTK